MANNQIILDIVAQTTQAQRDIRNLQNTVNSLSSATGTNARALRTQEQQMQSLGTTATGLAKNLGSIAVAYGALSAITGAFDATVKFEQSMKKLEAITQTTAIELEKMADVAKEFGSSTEFSANQVGDGMNFMAMAGLDASQIMESVGDVLNLATAGMVELGEASDIATNIMSGFGLEADDVGRITDVMVGAFSNSNTSVNQLGEAFKYVAPIASSLKISLEETATAIGIMGNAGLQGSIAGTALQTTLLRLSSQTPEATKAMKLLGVEVFDTSGKFVGIQESMKRFNEATTDMSDRDKVGLLKKVFGAEALKGVIPLMDAAGNSYQTLLQKIQNSNGLAEKSADKMRDSLKGAIDGMKSALEGLAIAIGSDLLPAMTSFTNSLTDMARGAKDFYEINKSTIKSVVELGTAVVVLSTGFKIYRGVVASTIVTSLAYQASLIATSLGTTALATATTLLVARLRVLSLALLTNPFTAILVGVGVAVAVFNDYLNTLEDVIATHEKLTAQIENDIKVLEAGSQIFENYGKGIKSTEKEYKAYAKTLGASIEQYEKQIKLWKQKDTEAFAGAIKDAENQIHSLSQSLETLGSIDYLSKQEESAKKLEEDTQKNIKNIDSQIAKLKELQETLIQGSSAYSAIGVEVQKLSDIQKRLTEHSAFSGTAKEIREIASETKILTELFNKQDILLDKLSESESKHFQTVKDNADKRIQSEQNVVTAIKQKQRDLLADLKALSDERLAIDKKYLNASKALQDSTDKKLFDAKIKGLNNYDKYLAEQLRADELYAKALDELKKDNLDVAKKYLDEYDSLKQKSAGEEIAVEDGVRVSRDQTMKSARDSALKYQLVMSKILADEKHAELILHNQKIEHKIIELEATKAQLQAQYSIIKALKEMSGIAGGVSTKFEIEGAEEAFDAIDRGINNLKQQKIDITAKATLDKSNADNGLNSLIYKSNEFENNLTSENVLHVDNSQAIMKIDETSQKLDFVRVKLTEDAILEVKVKQEELDIVREKARIFLLENKTKIISVDANQAKTEFSEMTAKAESLKLEIENIKTLGIDTTTATANLDNVSSRIIKIDSLQPKVKVVADGSAIDGVASEIASLSMIEPIITPNFDTKPIDIAGQKIQALSKISPLIKVRINSNYNVVSSQINSLNGRNTSSTHTIYYESIGQHSKGGYITGMPNANIPKFEDGGFVRKRGRIRGYGGGDTIKAYIEKGEYVVNKKATRKIGAVGMEYINRGIIPRFQNGGQVGALNSTSSSVSSASSKTVSLNLTLGNETFGMMTDENVANALERYTRKNQ